MYGFEIDDDRVRGEWLHAYPKGRKQVWFDRADDEIDFLPVFHWFRDNLWLVSQRECSIVTPSS
jgi:hypothetical protein